MKKYTLFIWLLLTLFPSSCQILQKEKSYGTSLLPPDGRILTFSHQLSFPGYAQQNLPAPFGLAFYTSLFQDVSVELKPGTPIRHLYLLFEHLENRVPLVLLRLTNNQLAGMVNGEYDDDIVQLANTINNYNRPIYLAPGFEVNNPMYQIDPAIYVKGYRYFVEKMHHLGVSHIAYVWNIIGMQPRWADPVRLEACYPGDDYVNWAGLNVQNILPHHYPDDGFFQNSIYSEVAEFAKAHGLPIMICESSTRSVDKNFDLEGDSLWDDWYSPFFKLVKKYNVRAICHIFYSYNDEIILNRWREEMAKNEYMNTRPQPNDILIETQ